MSDLTDPTAERTILGAVLTNPELLPSVESAVRVEHFTSRPTETVYAAMLRLAQAGRSIDLVTLRSELEGCGQLETVGGASYLASLIDDVPRYSNVDAWTRIVRDKAKRRRAIALAENFVTAAESGNEGTDQIIDSLQAKLVQLLETGERRTVKMADVLKGAMDELDNFANALDSVTGIPCGLIDVDKLLGGWKKGALYIVAARPSRGKSAFCAQSAAYAAYKGFKVLVFSMEMEPYQLASRMLLSEAEVDRWDLRKSAKSEYAWKKVGQAFEKLQGLPLWFDPRESPDLSAVRASVRQQRASAGVDLVVVDYLQRMAFDPKQDRWLAVGDAAKGLKSLARQLQVPVIAACQLTGEAEEKRPTLAMLGQAQSIISAEADVIGFLSPADLGAWRTQPYPQIDLIVDKHRNGPCMPIPLSFERSTTRFVSLATGPQQ